MVKNKMSEKIISVVKAYGVGKDPDSVIVVMPKELNVKPGTKFCVKKDERGRIIYEVIEAEASQ
jgi:hypothetical protein